MMSDGGGAEGYDADERTGLVPSSSSSPPSRWRSWRWPWQPRRPSAAVGTPAAAASPSKNSLVFASINLANGVIGAGIIGLPAAFNQAGLPLGVLMCIAVAVVSQYTIRLLAEVGTAHGVSSYLELSQRAFGPVGYYACSVFQAAFAFGAMIVYLVLYGDTVPAVLASIAPQWAKDHPRLAGREAVLSASAALILLPLCLVRSFAELARLGVLKFLATAFLTFTVCYYAARLEPTSLESYEWKYKDAHDAVLPALGTISFAFVCHHQTFLVLGSLRNPTPRRFAVLTSLAIFCSFALSLTVAVAGYLTFYEHTRGDLFDNYSLSPAKNDVVLNIARSLLALNMIITFPGELVVARQTVESVIERRRRHVRWLALDAPVHDVVLLAQLKQQEEGDTAHSADNWALGDPFTPALWLHVAITVVLIAAATGIACSTRNVTSVLNVTGSTAAVFLSFLLPAAIRLRLGASPQDTLPLFARANFAPWLVLVFGVVAFVASTGLSLYTAIVGVGEDGAAIPVYR